jgi:hypothetical protein
MTLEEMDKLPELAPTPWPFRGMRDFRGFTQDDYDNYVAGIFTKVDDPAQASWRGGWCRLEAAKAKIEELGYVTVVEPIGRYFKIMFRTDQ